MTTAHVTVNEALELLADLGATVFSGDKGDYFCTCVRCKAGAAMRIVKEVSPSKNARIYCTVCGAVDLKSFVEQNDAPLNDEVETDVRIKLDERALHGVIGDFVRLRAPHTEVGMAPVLFATLATIGVLIGRSPRWKFGDTNHHTVLFVLIVGKSGAGRKGSAINIGSYGLLELIDPEFRAAKVRSGLSSGEGLIAEIRDPTGIVRMQRGGSFRETPVSSTSGCSSSKVSSHQFSKAWRARGIDYPLFSEIFGIRGPSVQW